MSTTSLRTLAVSLDGSLGRRLQDPLKTANSFMLGRYLSDHHRHEKVPLGIATVNAKTSPAEDIAAMKSKIRADMPKAPGGGVNQPKPAE